MTSLANNAGAIVNQVVVPNLEQEIDDVRGLDASAGAGEAAAAIIGAMEELISSAKTNPGGFILGAEGAEKPEQMASRYGFTYCGKV